MDGLENLFYAEFYIKKLVFCSLNAKTFFHEIYKLATCKNSNFQIPRNKTCIKDHMEYIADFDLNKNKEASETYSKLISYLESNKFKMDKTRKIEIFKIWFYWTSGSNYSYWQYAKEKNKNSCSK